MKTLRVLVVDDEKPARTRLLNLLARQPDVETVGVARNGREAVAIIRAERPDVVFLDVQMPELDGLGVVNEITPAEMPATIFVTAYEHYALPAFEAHAFGYLLKPFSDERFEAALTHVRKFIAGAPAAQEDARPLEEPAAGQTGTAYLERIVIRTPGRVNLLPVDDIDWIEAAGVYVNLHVGARQFLHRSGVANLLRRLDPERFVRIHRSAAVNTSRVRELYPRTHGDYTIVLRDGHELLLSRAYRGAFEGWLRQRL